MSSVVPPVTVEDALDISIDFSGLKKIIDWVITVQRKTLARVDKLDETVADVQSNMVSQDAFSKTSKKVNGLGDKAILFENQFIEVDQILDNLKKQQSAGFDKAQSVIREYQEDSKAEFEKVKIETDSIRTTMEAHEARTLDRESSYREQLERLERTNVSHKEKITTHFELIEMLRKKASNIESGISKLAKLQIETQKKISETDRIQKELGESLEAQLKECMSNVKTETAGQFKSISELLASKEEFAEEDTASRDVIHEGSEKDESDQDAADLGILQKDSRTSTGKFEAKMDLARERDSTDGTKEDGTTSSHRIVDTNENLAETLYSTFSEAQRADTAMEYAARGKKMSSLFHPETFSERREENKTGEKKLLTDDQAHDLHLRLLHINEEMVGLKNILRVYDDVENALETEDPALLNYRNYQTYQSRIADLETSSKEWIRRSEYLAIEKKISSFENEFFRYKAMQNPRMKPEELAKLLSDSNPNSDRGPTTLTFSPTEIIEVGVPVDGEETIKDKLLKEIARGDTIEAEISGIQESITLIKSDLSAKIDREEYSTLNRHLSKQISVLQKNSGLVEELAEREKETSDILMSQETKIKELENDLEDFKDDNGVAHDEFRDALALKDEEFSVLGQEFTEVEDKANRLYNLLEKFTSSSNEGGGQSQMVMGMVVKLEERLNKTEIKLEKEAAKMANASTLPGLTFGGEGLDGELKDTPEVRVMNHYISMHNDWLKKLDEKVSHLGFQLEADEKNSAKRQEIDDATKKILRDLRRESDVVIKQLEDKLNRKADHEDLEDFNSRVDNKLSEELKSKLDKRELRRSTISMRKKLDELTHQIQDNLNTRFPTGGNRPFLMKDQKCLACNQEIDPKRLAETEEPVVHPKFPLREVLEKSQKKGIPLSKTISMLSQSQVEEALQMHREMTQTHGHHHQRNPSVLSSQTTRKEVKKFASISTSSRSTNRKEGSPHRDGVSSTLDQTRFRSVDHSHHKFSMRANLKSTSTEASINSARGSRGPTVEVASKNLDDHLATTLPSHSTLGKSRSVVQFAPEDSGAVATTSGLASTKNKNQTVIQLPSLRK
eukprot:CAMPEP_0115025392 /NCGR_PEP_ID=MMETSP0216-20121206/33968_1 /TAXON_ID=223996 /ORGANISM="Protocruzia adherens, Strain Boccale" /LENGTH=1074 /DNA_ID=CAMNT_0002399957 /DNA_START=51 /DNA_END=3275 /DNA_ORIENTATION=+